MSTEGRGEQVEIGVDASAPEVASHEPARAGPATSSADPATSAARRRPRRVRRWLLRIAVVLVLLLAAPAWSYGNALTAPGTVGWQSRSIGWIRDHGGSPLVDTVENWIYSHRAPKPGAAPDQPLPTASATRMSPDLLALPHPAPLPVLAGHPPLPGESVWQADPRRVGGQPVMYTAYFCPDQRYTSIVAGVAWLPRNLTTAHLIAGTQQPGGTGWPEEYAVPDALRPNLVAAFNSGFRMQDSRGGYFADGRVAQPLVDGAASLVIHRDGTVSVGVWGRDVTMSPDIVAVRQNLRLLVEHGAPAGGMMANVHGYWGDRGQQLQYTWRSAIGTDGGGNLVYVAANQVNLGMLAHIMVEAGIVQGMELDIHSGSVTFNIFRQDRAGSTSLQAQKLLPAMTEPATRYLTVEQRDFIAIAFNPSHR